MSLIRKISALTASAMIALLLGGCNDNAKADDIIILYTNDVHCAVDDDIG